MDHKSAFSNLSSEPTLTFGCRGGEIVGPLNPHAVHYGTVFGADPETRETLIQHPFPMLHIAFNKYRPDLPPWDDVVEIVVADTTDGGSIVEYILTEIDLYSVSTIGKAKMVTVSAGGIGSGSSGAVIDKRAVRDSSSNDNKVDDILT